MTTEKHLDLKPGEIVDLNMARNLVVGTRYVIQNKTEYGVELFETAPASKPAGTIIGIGTVDPNFPAEYLVESGKTLYAQSSKGTTIVITSDSVSV